jgi:phosphoglycerate kinase
MRGIASVNFKNKRVIIRVDFNVPLNDSLKITDISRLKAALPTIDFVLKKGGAVILMSHLGRPSKRDAALSLAPVAKELSQLIKAPVQFFNDCIGLETLKKAKTLQSGEIALLENLRFYQEEVLGDAFFAQQLADLADIYINDAFGSSHRAHASTFTITRFFKNQKYSGFLLDNEVSSLKSILQSPASPFVAVIGGAKVSGKIDVLLSLVQCVDKIIIGGGMAYTFIKAQGGNVGKSLIEKEKLSAAKKIIAEAQEKNVSLVLPVDSVNSLGFKDTSPSCVSDIFNIPENCMGLDIGPKSISLFTKHITSSKTILWNGPMGVFEFLNFSRGTKLICESICSRTQEGAYSLVGGGDSIAALKKFGSPENISYVSTGGGAMLEYLEGKELPALKALL